MPNHHANTPDQRQTELQQWFDSQADQIAAAMGLQQLPQAALVAASSDASFRRYFRWQHGAHSLLLMDAPPAQENSAPFVRIARLLQEHGLHVPKILAQDLERGFLAISDLGQQTWLEFFQADTANLEQAGQMFPLAISTLLQLQQIPLQGLDLPGYDAALLRRELELFPQWFVGHELGLEFSHQQQQLWEQVCQLLVNNALAQPRVLVHRDFMPRNLMLSQPNPGLIDFQDAVVGPVTYDLISLLKDAFISWPEQQVYDWLHFYWEQVVRLELGVATDFSQFARDCALMGTQRHLKVLGIFARICHRDGKPRYLADSHRFFTYLEHAMQMYPELKPLQQLLDSLPLAGQRP